MALVSSETHVTNKHGPKGGSAGNANSLFQTVAVVVVLEVSRGVFVVTFVLTL